MMEIYVKLLCCTFKHLSFCPEVQFIHWFIHSFYTYLLSTYSVPRYWEYKEKDRSVP